MKFIELTEKESNQKVLVLVKNIKYIQQDNKEVFVTIKIFNNYTFGFRVKETYEEVFTMINYSADTISCSEMEQ